MKKENFLIVLLIAAFAVRPGFAQQDVVFLEAQRAQPAQVNLKTNPDERQERTAINVGVLMGGGGLLGADMEFLIGKRAALQVGAGLGSVGCGIGFHFKPRINSQFVSVQYFHQGFGSNHFASYIGPMYVFRARKIFQAGIGFGTVVSEGPMSKLEGASAILLYNIGLYFPL